MGAENTKVVDVKIEGISGNNKVCIIHPFKVLSIDKSRAEDSGKVRKIFSCVKNFFKKIV